MKKLIGIQIDSDNILSYGCGLLKDIMWRAKKLGVKYQNKMFLFSDCIFGWARIKDKELYNKYKGFEIDSDFANNIFYKNDINRLKKIRDIKLLKINEKIF